MLTLNFLGCFGDPDAVWNMKTLNDFQRLHQPPLFCRLLVPSLNLMLFAYGNGRRQQRGANDNEQCIAMQSRPVHQALPIALSLTIAASASVKDAETCQLGRFFIDFFSLYVSLDHNLLGGKTPKQHWKIG